MGRAMKPDIVKALVIDLHTIADMQPIGLGVGRVDEHAFDAKLAALQDRGMFTRSFSLKTLRTFCADTG